MDTFESGVERPKVYDPEDDIFDSKGYRHITNFAMEQLSLYQEAASKFPGSGLKVMPYRHNGVKNGGSLWWKKEDSTMNNLSEFWEYFRSIESK